MATHVREIDVGDTVLCDLCGEDYTHSNDVGGIIFGSKACCPACTAKIGPDIAKYGEQHYIRARCGDDETFANFCRSYRGGDNKIRHISFDTMEELLDYLGGNNSGV